MKPSPIAEDSQLLVFSHNDKLKITFFLENLRFQLYRWICSRKNKRKYRADVFPIKERNFHINCFIKEVIKYSTFLFAY